MSLKYSNPQFSLSVSRRVYENGARSKYNKKKRKKNVPGVYS
jgi:hypothetical protein